MVSITLTEQQFVRAKAAGEKRYEFHRSRQTEHRTGLTTTNAGYDVTGAVGELAVAKYLGVMDGWVDFTPHYSDLKADVGDDIQVRTGSHRRSKPYLYRDQKPEQRFVFARRLGKEREVELAGWCWIAEAQQEQWWKEVGGRPPAYWPPRSVMRPMEQMLLCERQTQLWQEYEDLLALGSSGPGSKAEKQMFRRLDWWCQTEAEQLWASRLTDPALANQDCLWGSGRICPDAVACCRSCAATGRWRGAA